MLYIFHRDKMAKFAQYTHLQLETYILCKLSTTAVVNNIYCCSIQAHAHRRTFARAHMDM